jgi:hypothetical protein
MNKIYLIILTVLIAFILYKFTHPKKRIPVQEKFTNIFNIESFFNVPQSQMIKLTDDIKKKQLKEIENGLDMLVKNAHERITPQQNVMITNINKLINSTDKDINTLQTEFNKIQNVNKLEIPFMTIYNIRNAITNNILYPVLKTLFQNMYLLNTILTMDNMNIPEQLKLSTVEMKLGLYSLHHDDVVLLSDTERKQVLESPDNTMVNYKYNYNQGVNNITVNSLLFGIDFSYYCAINKNVNFSVTVKPINDKDFGNKIVELLTLFNNRFKTSDILNYMHIDKLSSKKKSKISVDFDKPLVIITNTSGIIDCSLKEPSYVLLINNSSEDLTIKFSL